MGKLLLYKPGRACQSVQINPATPGELSVHPYKDVMGVEHNTVYSSQTYGVLKALTCLYEELLSYVSADTEEDFSLDLSEEKAYAIRAISNIAYVRSDSSMTAGRVYMIQATNNGTDSVTVNSIKFTKNVPITNSSTYTTCLVMGYFLDNPVTIEVGATKTFAINFDS